MNKFEGKKAIQRAMIDLVCEKSLEKISITDIVRKAGISRSTYYYHYYEQKEIIQDLMNKMYEDSISYIDSLANLKKFTSDEFCDAISYELDYL